MKRLVPMLLALASFTASSFASSFGPLVEAEDLAAAQAEINPIILDIRGEGYGEAHIEGAVYAPYGIFRGPKENPGQLFDIDVLEAKLENIGLELDEPIVIVSAGKTSTDFGAAARVYWTLKSTGFTDLSILNGGQASWAAAGLPVSSEVANLMRSDLDLEFNTSWYASTDYVGKVVDGKAEATLIDSRLKPFFDGEQAHPAAKQPGTLPGAINHAFTSFFDGEQPAISKIEDISALKATLSIQDGQDVVSFCNTGHWAATHWFAVSELAGVENAKLYAGSMVEYSNAGLPMENTPGLIQNLLKQFYN